MSDQAYLAIDYRGDESDSRPHGDAPNHQLGLGVRAFHRRHYLTTALGRFGFHSR